MKPEAEIPVEIHTLAKEAGASACGIISAGPVDDAAEALYRNWITDGCHGTMDYCARHQDIRHDPRLLLDGARTLIVCAFNYYNPDPPVNPAPAAGGEGRTRPVDPHLRISRYAWGLDYHHVVKARLHRLANTLTERYGGECRVMVDTAPLRERYWAQRAGIGFIGLNNQLIVPGVGSYVFLGEILWTLPVSTPIANQAAPATSLYAHPHYPPPSCSGCMACVKACPGHALDGKGGCDARRCISYLTIEHRGDLPADTRLGRSCYGCDICQQVCPHNASVANTTIPEFAPDPALLSLTEAELRAMTPSHFRRLTRHSAMSRIPLSQLLRNLDHQEAPFSVHKSQNVANLG